MSSESVLQEHNEPENEEGLTHCPRCGFKVPQSIVICWNCGTRLKK